MIGLDRRLLSRLPIRQNFRIIDTPDLDVEPIRAREIDVAIPEGYVPGEEVNIFLGERAVRSVPEDDACPVIDPALGLEIDSGRQGDEKEQGRDHASGCLQHAFLLSGKILSAKDPGHSLGLSK
jgi:hypothetical protein